MNLKETLFEFEKKYPFLYEIEVKGVPIYTCFRDMVLLILDGKSTEKSNDFEIEKGRIYPKRIIDSYMKLKRLRNAKTLVFSSSMFRRDYGRNLAAEYLMDKYPETVVFEWPSRSDVYDAAYFSDLRRKCYCPLDFYIFIYKIYKRIYKKKMLVIEEKCRANLKRSFSKTTYLANICEQEAIKYLIREMPILYAETMISQKIFGKLFNKYSNIKYVIDFWGSARENIIPVLPGEFEAIELQHGIITEIHPGYIYPAEAKHKCKKFFERTILVYGEATKKLLTEKSIFDKSKVEIIGNPRIHKYKQEFKVSDEKRQYILFTSQPFEQDVAGSKYYDEIIPYLQNIQRQLNREERWKSYQLGIKLHPRENNGVKKRYETSIPGCVVFDNATQLYELLEKSFLHITATSTTLYEAALFDTPTILLPYQGYIDEEIYGFQVRHYSEELPEELLISEKYKEYLIYLKNKTLEYM